LSKRFIATLAGALAIVAVVAGCGGSSDNGDGTTAETSSPDNNGAPALTKALFIKQGDEICTETAKAFAQGIKDYMSENGLDPSEEPSEEQQEELIGEVILPAYKVQAEKLGELGAPKGEEEQAAEIVAGYEDAIADAEADPSGAIDEDPFADVKSDAGEFGFKVCGT
jgi:hypothetical protein